MAGARPILIWSILAVAVLGVAWLGAGRRIALFVDPFVTLHLKFLPVGPLEYDVADLRIGEVSLPLIGTDNQWVDLRVRTDSQNRLTLSSGGHSFTLGPRLTAPDPTGRPEIKLNSEPGDELSLELKRSGFSRPTPFEISFLGGSTPWWRRYLYYRLTWKKGSGAKLDMLWRFEQQFYSAKGWNEGYMMYDFFTGLIRVEITPEVIPQETAAVQYIARTKGWKRTDYHIESRGHSADGRSDVLAVIHLRDERSPSPGVGLSLVLYVDRASHQVTQELGGQ